MTVEKMADIPFEGSNPFEQEAGDGTSSDSPSENNETDETRSPDGEEENNPDEGEGEGAGAGQKKDVPFDEHPRWKERESEWKNRFNEQEKRHQDDIAELRKEFGQNRKEENSQIPSWFGGTQEQWDQYREWTDKQRKDAEDNALKRISETQSAQEKAVKEATEYMKTEMASIENDKTLNPEGKKIDPNKLLKIVVDNDLIDSKGRWNYRAGWRLMQADKTSAAPNIKDRKQIADATNSSGKGEPKPKNFKTTDDFKSNRPW